MPRPTPRRTLSVFAVLWLAALAGCGGTEPQDAPSTGFEPVTCSAQPSPCA